MRRKDKEADELGDFVVVCVEFFGVGCESNGASDNRCTFLN